MPINIKSGYPIKACISTYLIDSGFGSTMNAIDLVKTNSAGNNKKLGRYILNPQFGNTNLTLDSKIASIGYINASNQFVFNLNPTAITLGSWANAPGYTPFDNTDTSAGHVYVSNMVSQNNFALEVWSQINTSTISPGLITNSPKIVDLGVLSAGPESPFSSLKFETASRFELKLGTTTEYIPFLYGNIIIDGVIKLEGTGELMREATSSTNYILKHEQGGTASPHNGYTVTGIFKNGMAINPQTTGEVYNAFSGDFYHISVHVSNVNFAQPLINITGRMQELIIYSVQ
jgi:hypothetical protein